MVSSMLAFAMSRKIASTYDPFKRTHNVGALKQRIAASETRYQNATLTNSGKSDRLVDFFTAPTMTATVKRPPPKRNLIIVELESLENELLGTYNADYPTMLPFISGLVAQGTHFKNVISQPYTTWSVASLFAVQCNLPLLLHHVQANDQGKFHLVKGIRCLGDYLRAAGYRLMSYQSNIFVGDFKKHMSMHRWSSLDYKNHRCRRDWDLFAKIANSVFPTLINESDPFVLHIANADCHAIPRYFVDRRCTSRFTRHTPAIVRSFDCVDQIFARFVTAFEKSPLFATTDLIFYGDHVLMEGNYKHLKLHEPRSLVLAFPYHKKQVIEKPVSVYDLGPTILKMLGVDCSPRFPFGSDLFAEEIGLVPTVADMQTIYDFFTTEMNWDNNMTCWNGEKGFCTIAKS
jgi:phosphoglycerol transferase MdoB-like AlkP superfamily enzyme